MTDINQPNQPNQPNQQVSISDHINAQKAAIVNKGNEYAQLSMNIIDTWANNFVIAEKIKAKRTDQVNFFLSIFNQLANEGWAAVNQLGVDIKDPETSNKILDANNSIMVMARNVVNNMQQQEETFQKELQQMLNTNPPINQPKTEVKVQES